MAQTRILSPTEWAKQRPYMDRVCAHYRSQGTVPLAYIRTFGCQQNVADAERIRGMLAEMGFGFTDDPAEADFILFNTCAVREHAEDRVFGNVGALKTYKTRKPSLLIAVCGCMTQQEHIAEKLKKSYPFVGLVFGTHVLHRFPELLSRALHTGKRVFETPSEDGCIAEGLPVRRDDTVRAWLPIMYGCNNFCTYCIVPYVRGRERSRRPEDVLAEARELVTAGYKEITLLGQNVNSYGKSEGFAVDFPALLEEINAIPGDFIIRFMTSHPKDATPRLFDTIARCEKVSRHFHLPVQSGSNRILQAMNRRYTREEYLALVAYARRVIPDISFTSDIIVGFPGETREDFLETLSLVKEVGYTSLFTFIYSPRVGTPAAKLPDPVTEKEKVSWFQELTAAQEQIAASRLAGMMGKQLPALLESDAGGFIEARLPDNVIVRVNGDPSLVGKRAVVEITETKSWILIGKIVEILD